MPLIELKSHFWSICICNFTISYWSCTAKCTYKHLW